jgi:hypothetical protein
MYVEYNILPEKLNGLSMSKLLTEVMSALEQPASGFDKFMVTEPNKCNIAALFVHISVTINIILHLKIQTPLGCQWHHR